MTLARLLLLFITMALTAIPSLSMSKSLSPVQFKSALIYNFLRYVHWPKQDSFKYYHIGYYGDNAELYKEMAFASKTQKINGKPVKIEKINELHQQKINGKKYQLIYIDKSQVASVKNIASLVRQTSTLLITEKSLDKRDLMINIYPHEKQYKFEVNSSNITFEGLTLHKDILLLGGTKMDVAKLLRGSESALQTALKGLYKTQQALKKQHIQLKNKQLEAKKLISHISLQKKTLEKLKSLLLEKEMQMTTMNIKINELNDKSKNINDTLAARQKQLDSSQKKLNTNENEIKLLNHDIQNNKLILIQQKNAITNQKIQLNQKDVELSLRKNLLIASLIALCVFILMTSIIWRINKSKNKALSELANANMNIKTIANLGMEITACLNFEQAIETLYEHVQNLMDTTVFAIGIFNIETNKIEYKAAYHKGVKFHAYSLETRKTTNLPIYSFTHKKTILINDINLDQSAYTKRINHNNAQSDIISVQGDLPDKRIPISPQSMICTPIKSQDNALGIVIVQSPEINAYSSLHADLLTSLAAYTSVAFNNAIAHEKIKNTQQKLVIQEKMASLGLLTAGVAHEINNPTNFTQLSAQNLQVDLKAFKDLLIHLAGEDATPELMTLFDKNFNNLFQKVNSILEGSGRIRNTVKDLRNFTRQDSDEKCRIKISDNIQSTLQLVKSKFQETVNFECEFIDDPELDCWPAQLNQVFMNLIINACDAIEVKIQKQPKHIGIIRIKMWCENEHIFISFNDNGCGMATEAKQKAFEMFYTTKPIGKGTGLGLSISFDIIKKHQGNMVLESKLDQGSTFILSLPYL